LSGAEALARLPREIGAPADPRTGGAERSGGRRIIRTPIRYFDNDLFLAEWNAAFVYDPKFQDTVEVLEFLNIQVLELRFFDRLLHEAIEEVSEELRPTGGSSTSSTIRTRCRCASFPGSGPTSP